MADMPAKIWAAHNEPHAFHAHERLCTSAYIRADLVERMAAALRAMRVVMDQGPQPRKLDDALSWRECDEKARAMCDDAISAYEAAQ